MATRKQIGGIIALIVIAITNGWHLAPIQGYAWLTMAIEDTHSETFSAALQSAVAGKELCGICHYVVEQKKDSSENNLGYWNLMPKWLLATLTLPVIALARPTLWQRIISIEKRFANRGLALSPPPPKAY